MGHIQWRQRLNRRPETGSFFKIQGGGAEVALAQPHPPEALAWFNSHQGFSKDKFKWGINYRPLEPSNPIDPLTWTTNIPGLYYVNPNDPNSVDDEPGTPSMTQASRPFGYPDRPRRKFPRNVEPGSIIYAVGGTYSDITTTDQNKFRVGGFGTETAPIYVRGDAGSTPVTLRYPIEAEGEYVVVQGFKINPVSDGDPGICVHSLNALFGFDRVSHHLLFRNCDVTQFLETHNTTRVSGIGIYGPTHPLTYYQMNNVIIYRCKVTDWGNWTTTADDPDRHGIGITEYCEHVTIMECDLTRCEGNGIQLGQENGPVHQVRDIFIYRNRVDSTRQTSLWSKRALNVTFLQNKLRNSPGLGESDTDGAGIGLQDGPVNVKMLQNEISACKTGIILLSYAVTPASGITIDKNIIFDIEDPSLTEPPNQTQAGWAIRSTDSGASPVITWNTFTQCAGGFAAAGGAYWLATIANNTFTEINGWDIYFENTDAGCDSDITGNTPSEDELLTHPDLTLCP